MPISSDCRQRPADAGPVLGELAQGSLAGQSRLVLISDVLHAEPKRVTCCCLDARRDGLERQPGDAGDLREVVVLQLPIHNLSPQEEELRLDGLMAGKGSAGERGRAQSTGPGPADDPPKEQEGKLARAIKKYGKIFEEAGLSARDVPTAFVLHEVVGLALAGTLVRRESTHASPGHAPCGVPWGVAAAWGVARSLDVHGSLVWHSGRCATAGSRPKRSVRRYQVATMSSQGRSPTQRPKQSSSRRSGWRVYPATRNAPASPLRRASASGQSSSPSRSPSRSGPATSSRWC